MNNLMIPTDEQTVEKVARAIGRDRLFRDSATILNSVLGIKIDESGHIEKRFDEEFESLWSSTDEYDMMIRDAYRDDAKVAINAMNLLLLTSINI